MLKKFKVNEKNGRCYIVEASSFRMREGWIEFETKLNECDRGERVCVCPGDSTVIEAKADSINQLITELVDLRVRLASVIEWSLTTFKWRKRLQFKREIKALAEGKSYIHRSHFFKDTVEAKHGEGMHKDLSELSVEIDFRGMNQEQRKRMKEAIEAAEQEENPTSGTKCMFGQNKVV